MLLLVLDDQLLIAFHLGGCFLPLYASFMVTSYHDI